MTTVREFDSVRTTVDTEGIFDRRTVPAGACGAVVEVHPDGSCLAEVALAPQTADADGDFVLVTVGEGQYEVTCRWALMDWDYYWKRQPDGPFATLIRITTTYLHPEADDPESLRELAKDHDRAEMRVFKDELRQAIAHPGQLPGDELSGHVQYDDGSGEKFLRRLWRDLYGDEPVSAPGQA